MRLNWGLGRGECICCRRGGIVKVGGMEKRMWR